MGEWRFYIRIIQATIATIFRTRDTIILREVDLELALGGFYPRKSHFSLDSNNMLYLPSNRVKYCFVSARFI